MAKLGVHHHARAPAMGHLHSSRGTAEDGRSASGSERPALFERVHSLSPTASVRAGSGTTSRKALLSR